jgi:hypothetical protein
MTAESDPQPVSRRDKKTAPRPPRTVRLPVFVAESQVGLGDAIKRATSAVGIKPCGGCERRAQWLNARVSLTGRR